MSFKPGEITAEQALELGKELALRWTKNKHQFIVAAHTNTNNPHAHIIFNSVNLDCGGKFQDFKRSAIALRRLSDQICIEKGLSIIEKPKPSKGWNRTEYLGMEKLPSVRDKLRELIDTHLVQKKDFDSFITAMITAGCVVKRGKHLAFKLPDGKKFISCDSLGDDYTFDAIMERISGRRIISAKAETVMPVNNANKPNLLIDIQAKIREGKGGSYTQWARIFNIKEAAKTLLFLKENGIDSYDDLVKKSAAVSEDFNGRLKKIKEIDKRLDEISELQKQIGTYGKTKDAYAKYRASGWDENFYETHRADITLHKAAKKYFDGLGLKKLPTISSLKQEYATLLAEKKKLYSGYHELKDKRNALLTAKRNSDNMLDINNGQNRDGIYAQRRNNSYEI
jgi:hypothetical protein